MLLRPTAQEACMTEPLPPLTGGCLCATVRYEATPAHRDGYYCHCRMCQLAFGNTRAAYLNLRKDQVRWLNGPPAYYASSKIARRGFCSTCGTPLSFEFLDGENMDLSVGSLDDPGALQPNEHFAVESRIAGWHADDGLPGSRLDEHVQIGQRWRTAYGDAVQPGLATVRGTMPLPARPEDLPR
jgi:hypothetical protein